MSALEIVWKSNNPKSLGSGRSSYYSIEEALKLNEFEVFISMVKFMIGTGIFNRPFLYNKYGLQNCLISDFLNSGLTVFSNASLITCMSHMPQELVAPE